MPEKTVHASGRVIDRKTGSGVFGVNVEACDKDLLVEEFVGDATIGPTAACILGSPWRG
jgi:hypothetical protein